MRALLRYFALALVVALVVAPATPSAQEQPRTGGVLKAAMIGEPPSLDLHWTTAVITQQITWHVYELGDGVRDLLDPRLRGETAEQPRTG